MRKGFFCAAAAFLAGFIVGQFWPIQESAAQLGAGAKGFSEEELAPAVPASYGKLIAVSGVNYYFQADNGNIYIVRQKTGSALDTAITVIERS